MSNRGYIYLRNGFVYQTSYNKCGAALVHMDDIS